MYLVSSSEKEETYLLRSLELSVRLPRQLRRCWDKAYRGKVWCSREPRQVPARLKHQPLPLTRRRHHPLPSRRPKLRSTSYPSLSRSLSPALSLPLSLSHTQILCSSRFSPVFDEGKRAFFFVWRRRREKRCCRGRAEGRRREASMGGESYPKGKEQNVSNRRSSRTKALRNEHARGFCRGVRKASFCAFSCSGFFFKH